MIVYRERLSPSELRHTKPCKFFQRGQCILSAERCSFAHVKVADLHRDPRQYACAQARPGYHQHIFSPMVVANGPNGHFSPPSPLSDEMYVSPDMACFADHHILHHAHAPPPNTPFYAPHALPPYGGADVIAPLILHDDGNDMPSLTALSSPSTQSSSVPDVDDDADVPTFPHDVKYSHAAGGVCSPPPLGAYLPAPPYMSGMMSPAGYSTYCSYSPLSPPPPAPPVHAARSPKRVVRAFKKKNKNCKYFQKDGTCPKGAKCTFIHDPALARALGAPPPPFPSAYISTSSATTRPDDSIPRRPRSYIEELRAKGIYPITWRVIGGGVMMGGQRPTCRAYLRGECADGDDCRFAHPDDTSDTEADAFSPLSDEPEEVITPQNAAPSARRPEGLKIAIPAAREDIADVSPIPQWAVRTRVKALQKKRPSRPHSTPPRMPGVWGRRAEMS